MNTAVELLEQVVADLDEVLRSEAITELPDAEKMHLLRVAGEAQRRVDAVIVETIASTDPRPAGSGDTAFCGQFGCRTVGELLQRVLRTDAVGAGRAVKAAKAVRREMDLSSGGWLPARWPALRTALQDGAIGVAGLLAATGPVEQAGHRVGTEDRLRADAELAAFARGIPVAEAEAGAEGSAESSAEGGDADDTAPSATPEDLRVLAQVIVQYLDPDGAEPAEEIAMRARGVILGRAKDGVIPIRGGLLPEVAGQLQRIFDAYLNPRVDGPPLPGVMFRPSEETDPEGTDAEETDAEEMDPQETDVEDGVADGERRPQAQRGMEEGVLPSGDAGQTVDNRTRAEAARHPRRRPRDRRPPRRHATPGRLGTDAGRVRHGGGLRDRERVGAGRRDRHPRLHAGRRAHGVRGRSAAGAVRLERADHRDHHHRPHLHRPPETGDHPPRQRMPHPGMPRPRGLVRDPPRP